MVSGRMMKIEAITNDKFTLVNIDSKPVQVRALPMSDAVAWAALASAARALVDVATDFDSMTTAIKECAEVLAQYEGLSAEQVSAMSSEQVTGAIDALIEVNDPFALRRRRAEAEATKRQARELEILKALPPDAVMKIIEQNSDVLSVASPVSST